MSRSCPSPRANARPRELIIPSAVDPPARGAGQTAGVNVERPTGFWLTFGFWMIEKSCCPGCVTDSLMELALIVAIH